MKKVLFMTTALVATAGVASADVTMSGYGRVAAVYDDRATGGNSETDIQTRFRLQIDATTETDGGLEFGARVRFQQDSASIGGTETVVVGPGVSVDSQEGPDFNGVRYFMRYNGLEVATGNILGAISGSTPTLSFTEVGITGLGYEFEAYASDNYSSGGNNDGSFAAYRAAEAIYTIGDWRFHGSMSDENERYALAVTYTFGNYTFTAAGQDSTSDTDTDYFVGAAGDWGPVSAAFTVHGNNDNGEVYSLMGNYEVGAATSLQGYITSRQNVSAGSSAVEEEGFGLGFKHELGGGVTLGGGIIKSMNTTGDDVLADLGVKFNF